MYDGRFVRRAAIFCFGAWLVAVPVLMAAGLPAPLAFGSAASRGVLAPATSGPIPGSGSRTFPETGQTVSGLFLDYWDAHGGLAQQGFPISPVSTEVSALDGKAYTVQYFERAVFEYHLENATP